MDTIQLIVNYMESHLFEPERYWPKHLFEERVYERWAVSEILQRLLDNPFEFPDIVVEGFMLEMSLYSQMKDGTPAKVFNVARDTANDILCLIK